MSEVIRFIPQTTPPVSLTDSALKRVVTYLKENADAKGLKLSVKKTGCSGLSYVMDYVTNFVDDDIIIPLDDKYFVGVDKNSYPYLKGLIIDYVRQGLQYKFIFNNPNQSGQCGCGESFTVNESD